MSQVWRIFIVFASIILAVLEGFNIGQSTGIKAEITILCVQPPTVYLDSSVLKFYLVCQIHHLLLTPGLVETVQHILKSTANAIK